MTGRIHSVQSFGAVDGPGVRFVVFFQGCPLRCGYCHNPDTWDPAGGVPAETGELLRQILRCRGYFGDKGGVTLSGGEVLMQPEFAAELLGLCRAEGIHTAIDTSGCRLDAAAEKVLDQTDLVLLDLKMTTDEEYRRHTGCSLAKPLAFLERLEERGIPAWVRQVIVPGVNDTAENIRRLNGLLAGKRCVERVELLPFHKVCAVKYREMGIPFPFDGYPAADPGKVAELQAMVGESLGISGGIGYNKNVRRYR